MAKAHDNIKLTNTQRRNVRQYGEATPTLFGGVAVPKFKKGQDQLYADLLKKQLGFIGPAATFYDDPNNLAESYWGAAGRDIAMDPTGGYLADVTGDSNAKAAYDLSRQNQATMGWNSLVQSVNSPQGIGEIARMKAGLYGPETLTATQLLPSGYGPQKQSSPGIGSLLLGAASAAGGLGWSPFG